MSKTTKENKTEKPKKTLIDLFKSARRCGTPLIAITTPDQFATMGRVVEQCANGKTPAPFISWDCVHGFAGLNKSGLEMLALSAPDGGAGYTDLGGAASVLEKLGPYSVVFVLNAQRHLERPDQVQTICNLRNQYKGNFRSLVLLMPQQQLPAELQSDVILLDEPLPDQAELGAIVRKLVNHVNEQLTLEKVPNIVLDDATESRAVEAVQGLPAFAAEQCTAMSLNRLGLDLDSLWERKRQQIEQTPGLSVSREGIKFDDLGGLDAIKDYLRALLGGNARPNAIIFIDELDKCISGGQGDTSGVSQDQLGAILSYMQDTRAMGVLLVGHPGAGKSMIAKATGNEAGVPTIKLDLGAAKGSLVGQSEQQLRSALKVISSVSNGSTLWVATCNSLESLPPELRRRFKCGIFFTDLPSKSERDAIWKVYRAKHKISPKDEQPNDEGWTGAEIEQACELAWRLNRPLDYAANFVVPISQSAPDRVERLRVQADGKWLSASHIGVYRREKDAQPVAVAGNRKVQLED